MLMFGVRFILYFLNLSSKMAFGVICYITSLFTSPGMLSSAPDKAKLFAKNLSKNSNLDD